MPPATSTTAAGGGGATTTSAPGAPTTTAPAGDVTGVCDGEEDATPVDPTTGLPTPNLGRARSSASA